MEKTTVGKILPGKCVYDMIYIYGLETDLLYRQTTGRQFKDGMLDVHIQIWKYTLVIILKNKQNGP